MSSSSKKLSFSKVVRFVPRFLEPFVLQGGEQVGGDGGERLASFLVFARAELLVLVLDKAMLSLGLFMLAAAVCSKELMFAIGAAAGDAKENNCFGNELEG